jgi:hypothetical protein
MEDPRMRKALVALRIAHEVAVITWLTKRIVERIVGGF